MTPGRVACGLALLAVFCVLGIFFFPVMNGPYSAVHGPVTALLSIRAASRLRMAIRSAIHAVMSFVCCSLIGFLPASLAALTADDSFLPGHSPASIAVLRC